MSRFLTRAARHRRTKETVARVANRLMVRTPTPFGQLDLEEIRDRAVRRFADYPTRGRLFGMTRDLDDGEKRTLAMFEASIEVLNRMGLLDREKLQRSAPQIWTASQEVLDEGIYSYSVRGAASRK